MRRQRNFWCGNFGGQCYVAIRDISPLSSQISTNPQNHIALCVAFNTFIQNTSKNEKWSKSTLELVNSVKNLLFKFFCEDIGISLISRDDLLRFRNILISNTR